MDMWKCREEYTGSASWPIVPFRLTRTDALLDEPSSKIGLSKQLILGWSISLAELFHRPVDVWEKTCISEQRCEGGCESYSHTECTMCLPRLSAICRAIKTPILEVPNTRIEKQESIIDTIFTIMDTMIGSVESIEKVAYASDKFIELNTLTLVCDETGLLYFRYDDNMTGLVDIAFPVMCEGISIALVYISYISENDVNENIKKLSNLELMNCRTCISNN